MERIAIEFQTTNGTTAVVPPQVFVEDIPAEASYHRAIAAAMESNVPIHAVAQITNSGAVVLEPRVYFHETESVEPINYIVFEIQTTEEGIVSVLPAQVFPTRLAAEATYHYILWNAASSNVALHAAVLMNNRGDVLLSQAYAH